MASDSASMVFAADPSADSERSLGRAFQVEGFASEWMATGRAALGCTQALDARLWLIRTELPDMSGFELVEMLGDRLRHSVTCLVGDFYQADEERRARCLGVSLYVSTPLNEFWLRKLVRELSHTSRLERRPLAVGVGAFDLDTGGWL